MFQGKKNFAARPKTGHNSYDDALVSGSIIAIARSYDLLGRTADLGTCIQCLRGRSALHLRLLVANFSQLSSKHSQALDLFACPLSSLQVFQPESFCV